MKTSASLYHDTHTSHLLESTTPILCPADDTLRKRLLWTILAWASCLDSISVILQSLTVSQEMPYPASIPDGASVGTKYSCDPSGPEVRHEGENRSGTDTESLVRRCHEYMQRTADSLRSETKIKDTLPHLPPAAPPLFSPSPEWVIYRRRFMMARPCFLPDSILSSGMIMSTTLSVQILRAKTPSTVTN